MRQMTYMENHKQYTEELSALDLVAFKPFTLRELFFKRVIDIVGGLVGTLLFFITFVILFIPYHLSAKKDRGPMLYKQRRYGYHGKVFYIWKFRTMIVDAEDYLEIHPDVKEKYLQSGNKLPNDPRITRLGSFIRNRSIDELPQFINILKGDMSLVGPRPILDFERREYGNRTNYLWMCRPGITGYWVTHGRSKILYPKRAELELKYLRLHGFLFDLLLILQTIVQTFNGSDAY